MSNGDNVALIDDFAARLLGEHADDTTVKELAACLHYGNGLMRLGNTGRGLLVLGSAGDIMAPGAEGYYPRIVLVKTPSTPRRVNMGTTRFVGRHWRDIGDQRGLARQRPEGDYYPWAPVASRSLARIALDGPVGDVMAITPDKKDGQNVYEWRDLTPVPVGAVVFRVAGGAGQIRAFQRLTGPDAGDYWVKVESEPVNPQDYNNAYALVQEMGMPYTAGPNAGLPRPLGFTPALVEVALAANARQAKKAKQP